MTNTLNTLVEALERTPGGGGWASRTTGLISLRKNFLERVNRTGD